MIELKRKQTSELEMETTDDGDMIIDEEEFQLMNQLKGKIVFCQRFYYERSFDSLRVLFNKLTKLLFIFIVILTATKKLYRNLFNEHKETSFK